MAVVRAGDSEPSLLHPDIADPTASQPTQTLLKRSAKEEPFALAEDYSVNETGDRTTPLAIPPPPPVPIDLIQKTPGNRQVCDIKVGHGPATSKRQKYSLIAVALASVVLIDAVVTLLHGRNHNTPNPTTQVQAHVEAAPKQPAAFASIDAPPVAQESNATATQQETTAESAAIFPAASDPLDSTKVTLDLTPIDARVLYRGREVPGPPYEFDIAKGQHMAVEVLRFGFVTAKVVIDDKKPVVHFGMLREHRPKPR
jgi:hypothetical protein